MQAPSSQYHLPCLQCQDLSDLLDLDNIKEVMDNELLSLLNPQSGEGEGNQGDRGLWSLQLLLHSWPLGADEEMVDDWNHHPQRHPS